MKNIQKKVQKLINDACFQGNELGMQVVVYHQGKLIVDACGGYADLKKKKPVNADTLFPVFSVSKGISSTIIHILFEQGKLDYDSRIADYWPEFGCNGKSKITLRQALNHTAGLQNMPRNVTLSDLGDWDKMCRKIAKLKPVWKPGSQVEYHAITWGWLVGEVARRVDGRSFSKLLNDEICKPLNLDRMFIGLPNKLQSQVVTLDDLNVNPDWKKAPAVHPIPGKFYPLHALMNNPQARRACIPASSGVMNARSIAKHYAALLPGGIDGVELLSPQQLKIATAKQQLNDGTAYFRGLGYILGDKGRIYGSRCRAFGHGGFGGSCGFADPKYQLAIGLTKNLFSEKQQQHQITCEIRRLLGIPN